jgi:hypothetical protein
MQQLSENALATGRGLPGDVGAPPRLRVSQGDYTIGFGLFAPTLPRDHPEHRLQILEASLGMTLEEANTKALIGYLQVM